MDALKVNLNIGMRIKEIRKKRGLKQFQLASMLGFSRAYLSQIESGERRANIDLLFKIAKILKCNISDLVDVEDQYGISLRMNADILYIPVLSDISVARCKKENILKEAKEYIDYVIPVAGASLGDICTENLFVIKAEGNSMDKAKIHDGDLVIVAPKEDPVNGNVVLVGYGPPQKIKWMIRWYYAKSNGIIVFKAANQEYPDIEVTQEDREKGWYVYVGKVVLVQCVPKNGI